MADILDPNITDPDKYLMGRVKNYIEKIEYLAEHGQPEDSVKLKASAILLNKVMPDKTKMELDMKSQAPYEVLLKQLKGE